MNHIVNIRQALDQGSDNCLLLKANKIDSTSKSIDDMNTPRKEEIGSNEISLIWGDVGLLNLRYCHGTLYGPDKYINM